MDNNELEKELRKKGLWKGTNVVFVAGVHSAKSFSPNAPKEEKEQAIQSWKTIAVLESKSKNPFYICFMRGGEVWTLKFPITTRDRKFGMRIGKDDLRFFALDPVFESSIGLSFIEIIQEGDLKYSDLPIY